MSPLPEQSVRLELREPMFAESERPLLRVGGIRIAAFRYASGVAALRVRSPRLEMVWLPFAGQMIWDLAVDGESLKMRSMFEEPVGSGAFDRDYGMFLAHCGLTAMGSPEPEDGHPLHGELPHAAYGSAFVEIDGDASGVAVTLGGVTSEKVFGETHYEFRPRLTIRPESAVVELRAVLANLRSRELEYQYLCHLNWLPHDGAELAQSGALDAQEYRIMPDPGSDRATADYVADLIAHPERSLRVEPGVPIDPEYCVWMTPRSDPAGWAHAMQLLPDGRSQFVSWDAGNLPHAVRWVARTGDEDAIGFALPATGHHLGRTRSREDGLIRVVPPGGEVSFAIDFGILDEGGSASLRQRIRDAIGRG